VVSLLASHSEQSNQNYENQSDNWNTYRLSVNGSTKFTDIERMDLAAWVDTGGMGLQNTSGSTSNSNAVKMIDTINSGSAGGSAIFNTAWSEVKDIQAGVDVKQLSANNNSYLPGIVNSGVTSATTLTSSGTQWFQGLFAKGTYRPTDVPVDVTLGLRQDFWQTVNGTTSTTGSLANQNYTHFDPSLSAKYYATDALDFRGSVYQNFAAPGMNQMYRTFVSGGNPQAFWLANPNLQPETNFGQEIGFDFKQANYKFGGTIFNNTVNNYIDYIRCSSSNSCIAQGTLPSSITATNFNQYQNVGNANFKGFELLGNWDVTSSIGLNAGATRTLATLTSATGAAANQSTNPQVLDRQLGGVPSWVFTAGIKWQATSDLQFNAKMRAIPGYYDSLTATSTSPRDGGMAIFDLGANYRLNPSSTIYASIQNIGNRQYIDNQNSGYTNLGMPLNATVGIRYTF
jgi:outer membrane receptor protein involved in Fe transport